MQQLAATAYQDLGDYDRILPSWLVHPGVLGYISEARDKRRRGFLLLGFYEEPDSPPDTFIADLLALAVDPGYRRQGVGRALLRHAVAIARSAGRRHHIREIRLTVAHDNAVGQHLYTTDGFRVVDDDHGSYDGGQRAIRMSREV
jgi:ribosomal protein S18 acetylase RimI-like enzyme